MIHPPAELGPGLGLGLEESQTLTAQSVGLVAAARQARSANDMTGLAATLHDLGRMCEKAGRMRWAETLLQQAEGLYGEVGDRSGIAQCWHTVAVWHYHRGGAGQSFRAFGDAARLREDIVELRSAAQSWHNLGYAQLRDGALSKSDASYAQAQALLDRIQGEGDPELVAKARRDSAFVLSHRAFAAAQRAGGEEEALASAVRYFDLTSATGVHREPLLAYVGVALALIPGGRLRTSAEAERLAEVTGLRPDPDAWFEAAQERAQVGLVTGRGDETGRRPYLGAILVVLSERGRWYRQTGRTEEGDALIRSALARARARGWMGEARRIAIRNG